VSFRFFEDEGKLAGNRMFVELMRFGVIPYYWKCTREVDCPRTISPLIARRIPGS